jgi:hypothetical protein
MLLPRLNLFFQKNANLQTMTDSQCLTSLKARMPQGLSWRVIQMKKWSLKPHHIGAARRAHRPKIFRNWNAHRQKHPSIPARKAFEGVGKMQTVIFTNGTANTEGWKNMIAGDVIWEKLPLAA